MFLDMKIKKYSNTHYKIKEKITRQFTLLKGQRFLPLLLNQESKSISLPCRRWNISSPTSLLPLLFAWISEERYSEKTCRLLHVSR